MRALEQQTILVTGATDGLGRGLAERLAEAGAHVLLHGRDPERVARTAEEIASASGADPPRTYVADLSSLEQVDRLAGELERDLDALHVLVNNAGIGSGRPDAATRQESRDGHELRFAVNYLAPFLLTLRLLPLLRRSAPARVVNVASLGQAPIDFEDPMIEHGYSGMRAYSQSKLAQISFTLELARRVPPEEVSVTSLHPSTFMPTKIVLEEAGRSVDTLEQGVQAALRLVAAPELEGVSGRFYDRFDESRANAQAYDPEARGRLWALSRELTGAPDA